MILMVVQDVMQQSNKAQKKTEQSLHSFIPTDKQNQSNNQVQV